MELTRITESFQQSTSDYLQVAEAVAEHELDLNDVEGWSPRQIIHHVADSEAQAYARLRRLLAEPGTQIQGYDEGIWAQCETLGYKELPVAQSLAVFRAVREATLTILGRISMEESQNKGVHSESGDYGVLDWIKIYTKHPIEHAQQILNALRR